MIVFAHRLAALRMLAKREEIRAFLPPRNGWGTLYHFSPISLNFNISNERADQLTSPSSGQASTDSLLEIYTPCLPLRGSVRRMSNPTFCPLLVSGVI